MRTSRWLALVVVAAALLASCTNRSSKGTGAINGPTFTPIGVRTSGGTVTFAESAGFGPNYIFPLYSAQYCTSANAVQFQPLMYRPLYWYGNNDRASVDYDASIGNQPDFSKDGKTVTISMKPTYTWSDGEPVDARDVIFWMNLIKAEKQNWCGYVPGYFPDNVVGYSAVGPYSFRIKFDKAYNQTWVIYNELSQITPIPLAWDTPASGLARTKDNGHLPDASPGGAQAVYNNLNGLAKRTDSFASSPVWAVIDGPFRLSRFTSAGEADFVPNARYTGPDKPQIAQFKELPFSSDQPELQLARSGPAGLTIGYLPIDQLTEMKSLARLGYYNIGAYTYSAEYFPLNLNNPTFGPVFRQPYFRQAFQHLVDQSGWIKRYQSFGGRAYASPTYGLVPAQPPSAFSTPDGTDNPYPFSTTSAAHILSGHGWAPGPNGARICANPGTHADQCGLGVRKGLVLSFGLDYASGLVYLDSEMKDLKVAAAAAGIDLQLTTHPLAQVVQAAVQCEPPQPPCRWTVENWGGGWDYSPDFYPSGEQIVQTMAGGNYSNYSSDQMNGLVAATTLASESKGQSVLNAYQDFVRQQVPFVFEPNTAGNPQPGGPVIVSRHLGGFTVNAFGYITPETYYLTK